MSTPTAVSSMIRPKANAAQISATDLRRAPSTPAARNTSAIHGSQLPSATARLYSDLAWGMLEDCTTVIVLSMVGILLAKETFLARRAALTLSMIGPSWMPIEPLDPTTTAEL